MVVAPTQSLLAAFAVPATAALSPLTATAGVDLTGLTGFAGDSTVVELSGLGQLLSATSLFQSNLAALQPGSTNSGIGFNFGTDFASLAAEAQNFVDTFNNLQNTLASLQGTSGLLGAEFAQALNGQATAALANGTGGPNTLAQLGIEFQTTPGGTGTLAIDVQALQAAFAANPGGTFSLLTQAVQSFGNLAASFTAQAGAEANAVGAFGIGLGGIGGTSLADILALESLGSSGSTNTFGFADLLALSVLGGSGTSTLVQQLMALNEFNLVATLPG